MSLFPGTGNNVAATMIRVAMNKFVSKKLGLTEGEVCRLTDDELRDLITTNSNKIPDIPKDEITRLATAELDRLPKEEFFRLMFHDVPEGQQIILPHSSPHIFFIAGTFIVFVSALVFITTQVNKWVVDLNKRLSFPKCDINVTKIPRQERLKIITFSNYSETPCRKLQGLKGIGKTHKGMRQLQQEMKNNDKMHMHSEKGMLSTIPIEDGDSSNALMINPQESVMNGESFSLLASGTC